MALYKGIEIGDDLAGLVRHMGRVEEYRETLQGLQTVWDSLTLLGQLSGTGIDMSGTRQAFNRLTGSLLNNLGTETLKKTVLAMTSKAQVAIDILIRNLFERTADIGFLATDQDVRDYLKALGEQGGDDPEARLSLDQALRARFLEYVKKYSVYSNIILLDLDGNVLVQLDPTNPVNCSDDPLIAESLRTDAAYVETFRHTDLVPGQGKSLIYSYRVTDGDAGPAIGVMCLCFRFENEMDGIFANLHETDDWSVILMLDRDGGVIASSDPHHIPLGAQIELVLDDEARVMRFAGREYLAATRATKGYQGYMGPGWYGQVMVPVQHAFDKDASDMLRRVAAPVLAEVMRSPSLFPADLRGIPEHADQIQSELNRSVWNGNVRQSSDQAALNPAFSKILLWEISNTGLKTKDVFERSIGNLNETVVSAILQDCEFVASLAIDIMDRNLYERANDCRWWALTSRFREALGAGAVDAAAQRELTSILGYINGLYTVYENLVLFDRMGRVIAVSNPRYGDFIGQTLGDEWVRQALGLRDAQSYCVSPFVPCDLYGGRHTYAYAAAIRDGRDRVVGGIGIIFDSEPQFAAMLSDSLPRNEAGQVTSGAFGLFADRSRTVIASTRDDLPPGTVLDLDDGFFTVASGQGTSNIVAFDGQYYAVGSRMSQGYREYKGPNDAYRNDVVALVFVPLCEATAGGLTMVPAGKRVQLARRPAGQGAAIEVATFHVGGSWFGMPSRDVIESVAPTAITRVPGAANGLIGYMMYRGSPIPVIDIGLLVQGLRRDGPPAQLVMVRAGESLFGVVVDSLGEIPEIPSDSIEPISDVVDGGAMLTVGIANLDDAQGQSNMLMILSPQRILNSLRAVRQAIEAPLEVAAQ